MFNFKSSYQYSNISKGWKTWFLAMLEKVLKAIKIKFKDSLPPRLWSTNESDPSSILIHLPPKKNYISILLKIVYIHGKYSVLPNTVKNEKKYSHSLEKWEYFDFDHWFSKLFYLTENVQLATLFFLKEAWDLNFREIWVIVRWRTFSQLR